MSEPYIAEGFIGVVGGIIMACIMIVEDERQVLVLAESILKDAGHETLSAANHDGAAALLEVGERPDLLFVDHNLGEGLSGIDTAREARRQHSNIHVLYTSGDASIYSTRS